MGMPKVIAEKLTKVLENVFADLQRHIETQAKQTTNCNTCATLHEVSAAIDLLDISYLVHETLEVTSDDPPSII